MLDKHLIEVFCQFLDKRIGLHYPRERWHDLERKLILIRKSLGFDNTSSCIKWLMSEPINKKVLNTLIYHLTVGETYFFRDKKLFNQLEQEIFPDIIKRRQKYRSIKVWSVACCTGEEAYSLAILLHRLIPDIENWHITILATDINMEFLKRAKKAQYKDWSFRSMPPGLIPLYFKKNRDDTYTLIPEIQQMVTFKHLNLVEDTYPDLCSGICEMDLIFCHNVLIYFSKGQIKKTIHNLTKSLSNNGWLSVAAVENPFVTEASLNVYRYPGAIFFKKGSASQKEVIFQDSSNYISQASHSNKEKEADLSLVPQLEESRNAIFNKCMHLYQQKAYKEVIELLQPFLNSLPPDSLAIREYCKEVILLARTFANQGDLYMAQAWIDKALKVDSLNPMLHYLQAVLLHDQGNNLEAIKFLKKALFIESNFLMAYMMLGILEKQQGNKKAALHNFKIALELIDKHPPDSVLPHTEGFKVSYLKEIISGNLISLKGAEV